MSVGKKMFVTVMAIFLIYGLLFIIFEDIDFERKTITPLGERIDWHLLIFSLIVFVVLAIVLFHFSRKVDQRIQKEKMSLKAKTRKEMVQNIAHELKTPISSIMSFSETILYNPNVDEETKNKFVERIFFQSKRLASLAEDISALNKMSNPGNIEKIEEVDISLIVKEIVESISHSASKNSITIHNWLSPEIIIEGDYSLIYSIFRNLFDNSVTYAGKGAVIDIVSRELDDKFRFVFSDNGVGVAPEHLPYLFDKFYRVDKGRSRALGGTGLGLSIVKSAILLHGGSIEVRQTKGGGLTFDFTLGKSAIALKKIK